MVATIKVGKAGRLVVPKAVRERLRLLPAGTLIKLEWDEAADVDPAEVATGNLAPTIVPADDEDDTPVQLERLPNGMRVIVGWEGFDAVKAIKEARTEAEDRLLGKLGRV